MVEEIEEDYFGEDDMPELFDPENRDEVEFDSSNNSLDKCRTFKIVSCVLPMLIIIFYAAVYGLMYCKLNGQDVLLENAKETLGSQFFIELKKIEKSAMLDHSILVFLISASCLMVFYSNMVSF